MIVLLRLAYLEFFVYPVPSDGQLFIQLNMDEMKNDQAMNVLIYSMTGKKVFQQLFHPVRLLELSLQGEPSGLYLLRIIQGAEVYEKKLILN